jgi:hypothetical protein
VLLAVTLIVAATRMEPSAHGLEVYLTGRMFGVILTMHCLFLMAFRFFDEYEMQQCLWEAWRFVKKIFPLLMRRILYHLVLIFLVLCWHPNGLAAQPESGNSLLLGNVPQTSTDAAPHMMLSETTFDFKEVLEGSVVSHDFIVWNIGNAVLKIEQVGPTCGCLKADFDESIPPGGAGRITLIVDFADHEGPLERTVGVFTNDPDSDDATLSIKGTAKPLLQMRPGDTVSLGSGGKQLKKASIGNSYTSKTHRRREA